MIDADPADDQESGRYHNDLQNHQFGAVLPRHHEKDDWYRCSLDGNAPRVSQFFSLYFFY